MKTTVATRRLLVEALHYSRLRFKDNARQFLTMSHFLDEIYCTRINEGTDFGHLAGTDRAKALRFRRVG